MNSSRARPLHLALLVAGALAAAGCDGGPAPGPGVLTVSVVSPHGAEGAAVVELHGPGIQGVTGSGGWVWGEPGRGDTVAVVVVADEAGALSFRVAVADTLAPPRGALSQVAGPDDALRGDLEGYRLEILP